MSYHWDWGNLLSAVPTGDPTTYLGWLIAGLEFTLAVSLSSWVIALLAGSLFGVMRTLPNRGLASVGAVYTAIFRNIPLIVQFFIWYLVIPDLAPPILGMWFKQLPPVVQFFSASIICLSLFTGARVCEQVRASIEALPRGQKAAAYALGLTLPQTYRYILLPNAYRIIVPPLTSELLNTFKNSAVASTIGLLELSAQARQIVDYTAQAYEAFISVTFAYFLINIMMIILMSWIEKKSRLPAYIGRP